MPSDRPGSGRPPVGAHRAVPGDDAPPGPAEPVPGRAPAAAAPVEMDDTRPVSRDWLAGAPDPTAPGPTGTGGATDVVDPASPAAAGEATAVIDRPAGFGGGYDRGRYDDGEGGPPGTPPGDGADGDGHPRWWRRPVVLATVGLLVVLAAVYGIDLLLTRGDVPRNTVVSGVDVGGLAPAAAAARLEERLSPRVAAERTVVADDVTASLAPEAAGIALDVPATVDAATEQPLNPLTRLRTLFADRTVDPVLGVDETALAAQLESIAATVDRAPVDASITIDGTTPSLVDPVDGRLLDRSGATAAITAALTSDGDPATPIDLPVEVAPVAVEAAEAQRALDEIVTPALAAPVQVVSADGGTRAEVPVAAIAAALRFTAQDDGELVVDVDPADLKKALGDHLSAFGEPAEDAGFEVSGGTVAVVPSVDGTGVDPQKLADQLMPVLTDPEPRSVTAELGPVPADFSTADAEALGITEEISSFTTTFSNPASGTNIRVVAAEVDGAIVKPGETFSLNDYTGPRGTEQGYVPANVISGGQLSTAVGGGISQFATTMFNAVFFAGLEDIYHKPHSFYISRYPAGREATVYEGLIDLQWRNDTETGVFVDTAWTPGSLTVTFYGTKHYDIDSISGERTNYRKPAVQDKVDDGKCIPQSGVAGFDITVTRVFRDLQSGAEIRRENFNTRYAAEAIIHCVPKEEKKKKKGDGTPSSSSPSPSN